MITKEKLKSIIKESSEMRDELMKEFKDILQKYHLVIYNSKQIDKNLEEFLTKPPRDIVDSSWDKLQEYLLVVNNWKLFIRREINLRKVYYEFIAKRKFYNKLREERVKLLKDIRFSKMTDQARKEKIIEENEDIRILKLKMEAAEMNYELLKGFDEDIHQYHFTLQNIIKRIEREYMKQQIYPTSE